MALEIRVLVVEDDPETRMLTEALLSGRKGVCLCALAKDGLEGLELVEQTRPDIVLLDLILPGMDGLDFLRALRRRSARPAVVVASQASEPTVIRLAFQLGASYYLIKPHNFDSLPDLFHSLCLEPRERAAADYLRGWARPGWGGGRRADGGRALHGRGGAIPLKEGSRRHGGPKHQLRLRGEKHPLHGGQAQAGACGEYQALMGGLPAERPSNESFSAGWPGDFGVVAPRFP
ncbi:MAG: response regulator [Flavonifractor plautii]